MLVRSLRAALLKLDRMAGAKDLVAKAVKVLGSFISAAKVKYEGMEFGFDLGKEEGVADTGDLDYDLSELLQSVGAAAQNKKTAVVIFIDELQYVPEAELAALISALHACAQKRLPVAMVGAGLPQLVGNVGRAKSYAERLFDFPVIGALPDEAATEALQRPVELHQVAFAENAIAEILTQTQGYPYFLQEWGSMCWTVANTHVITKEDAVTATDLAILQLDSGFFRVRFDRCTPMEKNYLRAMAEINMPAPRSGDIAAAMKKEVIDILPSLKEGDSYCAYAASRRSARRVPAADGLVAPFTSQAIWAIFSYPAKALAMSCPSFSIFVPLKRIFVAPTRSAWFS